MMIRSLPRCSPLVFAAVLAASGARAALLAVNGLGTLHPAMDMAQLLTGCGIVVEDARIVGNLAQFGVFTTTVTGLVGFTDGLIISTGAASSAPGPNNSTGMSTAYNGNGLPELDALTTAPTHDAAMLEFDFFPSGTTVTFDYVFASEEYNDFVNSPFNDVFAFWLDGVNVALLPGTNTPVAINNVNGGGPVIGQAPVSGSAYFIDNDAPTASLWDPAGAPLRTAGLQYDGLTVVFHVSATVTADERHTMKFAIADASDQVYDSAVFLRAGSFVSTCGGGGGGGGAGVAGGAAGAALHAEPNPFRPGTGGLQDAAAITLRNVPVGATVRIYTIGGSRVVQLVDADQDGVVTWDGRTATGETAASGVYVVHAQNPAGQRRTTKLVIIR